MNTKKPETPADPVTELARRWADQHWMPWALLCQHDRVVEPVPTDPLTDALARRSVW